MCVHVKLKKKKTCAGLETTFGKCSRKVRQLGHMPRHIVQKWLLLQFGVTRVHPTNFVVAISSGVERMLPKKIAVVVLHKLDYLR